MKLLRRLIAWSCFLGFLTAVGVGVFHFIPHRPLCTIEGPMAVRYFSPDGRWLICQAYPNVPSGPGNEHLGLRVFDGGSGQMVHSFRDLWGGFERSPHGRHLFVPNGFTRAHIRPGVVSYTSGPTCIVDWQSGKVWQPPVFRGGGFRNRAFSPQGRWLWLETEKEDARNVVIDLPAHRLIPWPKDLSPQFTRDDRHGLCIIDNKTIRVVEIETGRSVATMHPDFTLEHAAIDFSLDGRHAVIGNLHRSHVFEGWKTPLWAPRGQTDFFVFVSLEVWDVVNFQRIWAAKSPAAAEFCSPALSPNGQFLAYWTRTMQGLCLEMVDLHSGAIRSIQVDREHSQFRQRLSFLDMPKRPKASDNSAVLLTTEPLLFDGGGLRQTTISSDGRVLWKEPENVDIRVFKSNANFVLQQGAGYPIQIDAVDLRTGKPCRITPPDFQVNPNLLPTLSASGHVAIIGKDGRPPAKPGSIEEWLRATFPKLFPSGRPVVLVVDAATGRECLRLPCGDIAGVQLSADGSTLATIDAKVGPNDIDWHGRLVDWDWDGDSHRVVQRIQLWDVHPHRAYFWAIAWSLSVGGVLLLLRHWRLKRINNTRASTANMAPSAAKLT